MATIAKSGTPSLSTRGPCPAHRPTGLVAGEDIAAGDLVYVKNDGKLWRANGTAATAPALAVGFAAAASKSGEACTPLFGCCMYYGAGLTPGARYYASATPGAIDDAATTGGTVPVAYAWDATQIYIFPPTR
jgi:hypothetical protein